MTAKQNAQVEEHILKAVHSLKFAFSSLEEADQIARSAPDYPLMGSLSHFQKEISGILTANGETGAGLVSLLKDPEAEAKTCPTIN